jgi:hypothetical protein
LNRWEKGKKKGEQEQKLAYLVKNDKSTPKRKGEKERVGEGTRSEEHRGKTPRTPTQPTIAR